jgi:hydroxymethylpyrimidine pyrophosphatase-like HAD family hydrolase
MRNVIITQLKNQEERIYEWMYYHNLQGFDTFIIFDDYSEDNSVEEIKKFSEKFPEVKIILSMTDGVGGSYNKEQCKNSESYGGDISFHRRLNRSYTQGNKIAKEIDYESICAIIDVDEFLFSDSDLKVVDILHDIFQSSNYKQIKVINFDMLDNYDLQRNIIKNNIDNLQVWSYQDLDNNNLWRTRSKCIIKSKEIDQITFVHDVLNGQFPTKVVESETYIERNYQNLRLLHFRKPNLPTKKISFIRDENVINKFKKIFIK